MVTSKAGAVLRQALWFGLLTGLCEAGLVGVKRQVLGRFVRFGPDIAWMAPVADAIAFLAVGCVLVILARLWAPIGRPAVATAVLAAVAGLSVLLMYYPLHLYAKVLLAVGVAVQTARLAARWPQGFDRLISRGLIVMIAGVAVLLALSRGGPWLDYRRQVHALPAAPSNSPNVVLIVWDTVRASSLSVYGYGRPTTPHLQQWASTSAVFDNASSTSPWTLPSHASLLTGQWAQELSATWETALDGQPPTLGESLSRRGYVTGGFVANTYYCGHELGLARGFARYEDYVVSPWELLISSTMARTVANSWPVRRMIDYHDNIPRQDAAAITDHFLRWQATTGGRPFFAFLNFYDAHESYLPPPEFARAFDGEPPPPSPAVIQDVRRSLRRDWPERPAEEIRRELNLYDGAIAYLDDQLNRLLLALQARGVLDNTIVIVTSDHGEQFGEHGLFLHGNSLYRPLLHVPLVIRFPPAVPAGRRVSSPATLRDVPATVVGLLGLAAVEAFPGRSLVRHWSGTVTDATLNDVAIAEVREADWAKQTSPWYPAAKGDMESVTDATYHYIRNGDGTEELYAIASDPEERRDLGKLPESRPILERYRAALRAAVAKPPR